MSNGPIEFLGEEPVHEVPRTEFGGADGLIQPEDDTILPGGVEASGGHRLDGDSREVIGERSAIMARAAREPVSGEAGRTGVDPDQTVVDPVSGRFLADSLSEDGLSARLSDLRAGG